MDLGTYKAKTESVILLTDELGAPLMSDGETPEQMSVTISEPHLKSHKRASFKYGMNTKKFLKGDEDDLDFETLDKITEERIDFLVEITTDCHLFINGKFVEFSKELIKNVYSNENTYFIAETVNKAVLEKVKPVAV